MHLEDPQAVRDQLFLQWDARQCFGRIYVATEGINAQMSVPEHHWEAFVQELSAWEAFRDVPFKIAVEDDGKSFFKLTVKVRAQIVADGLTMDDYDVTNVGRHLNAAEWNALYGVGGGSCRGHCVTTTNRKLGILKAPFCLKPRRSEKNCPRFSKCSRDTKTSRYSSIARGEFAAKRPRPTSSIMAFRMSTSCTEDIIDYARQIQEAQLPNRFKGQKLCL